MYNGEVNAEKLDNWIWQLEVYFRIQILQEDDIKIQLASPKLEGDALVWLEEKTREEMWIHGKISISWVEFVSELKDNLIL